MSTNVIADTICDSAETTVVFVFRLFSSNILFSLTELKHKADTLHTFNTQL